MADGGRENWNPPDLLGAASFSLGAEVAEARRWNGDLSRDVMCCHFRQ